jgi:hypothetical protein
MKQALTSLFTWLKSVYSESDGTGSSTRIHITLLITFVLGVGISFGVLVHHKSITIEQFNSFLGSAATFLTATCGPLYGVNKLADWAAKKNVASQTEKVLGEP